MLLHKDYDLFYDAILAASNLYKIPPALIEKDYYKKLLNMKKQ